MKRRSLLLAMTSLAAAGCALGADKPDFSGTWTIDLDKSDFGMLPPPTKMERKIEHKEPEVKITTVQANARGERTTDAKYTTDGKVGDIQVMGRPAKVTAVWDGAVLVVTTKAEFQGSELVQVERWSKSEDGKTLNCDGLLNSPMGENKSKMIFKKQ